MPRKTFAFVLGICIALAGEGGTRAQGATPRIFVLDEEERSLTAVDMAGSALKTATLQGSPKALVRTPDGRRLLVLDRGPGKDAGDAGYQAKGKSAVTIVDSATLEIQSRVEMGWGLELAPMLGPAGERLSVMCPGYVSRKPDESLPREIVTVDLASGQVVGRLALPRPVTAFFSTPDGKTAVILSARDKPKQTPPLPAELRFVDLAAPSLVETITLEGDPQKPVLSPDGKFVYLLDVGKPSGNVEKNVNGRLYIISVEARRLQTMTDVGSKPRGFVLDETGRQLLLLSDAPPKAGMRDRDRSGELRVIRGGEVLPVIKVGHNPGIIRAAPDGNRLFVVSEDGIAGLALPDLTPLATTPSSNAFMGLVVVTPDGRRGFSLLDEELKVYDLEAGKELAQIRTGRMGKRLLLATEAVVFTELSKRSGEQEAVRTGQSYYTYTEYSLKDTNPAIAARPDGKAVYALNRATMDVTIVDAENGTVVEKIGADGSQIRFLSGGAVALVVANSAIHQIDTASNKKLDDLAKGDFGKDQGFTVLELSPDGKYGVAYGPQVVLFIDNSSGKPVATLRKQKRLADVEFDWLVQR